MCSCTLAAPGVDPVLRTGRNTIAVGRVARRARPVIEPFSRALPRLTPTRRSRNQTGVRQPRPYGQIPDDPPIHIRPIFPVSAGAEIENPVDSRHYGPMTLAPRLLDRKGFFCRKRQESGGKGLKAGHKAGLSSTPIAACGGDCVAFWLHPFSIECSVTELDFPHSRRRAGYWMAQKLPSDAMNLRA